MTDGRADVARDALRLFGEDAEARKSRVHVHERRQRTSETTPDPSAEPKVKSYTDDAAEEDVHGKVITQKRNPLEQGGV